MLLFLFWPATAFMGCCLCDKRKKNKNKEVINFFIFYI